MRIGVDLGGTNTVVCLCREDGTLLAKKQCPTHTGQVEQIQQDMKTLALALCEEQNIEPKQITQIGIGVPGTIDKEHGMLLFGTNLGIKNVCFTEAFCPEFAQGVVRLENDANCAALGEVIAGAGMGCNSAVMVTLGTGVGGGIVMQGRLYTGCNDIAGEIGHMVVEVDGWQCNCGRRGCLEAYASATGMVRLAEAEMAHDPRSILHHMRSKNSEHLTAKMVCDACDRGDAAAQRTLQKYSRYLGEGLSNLVNILQPEKIILGGGVAGYGEKLLQPLRDVIEHKCFRGTYRNTEIVSAVLGNDAGLIGAAML